MKKYIRWAGSIILSPIILFFLVCTLLYIPTIQNYLVKIATNYLSETTGMQISIKRISLEFPLDVVIHQPLLVDNQDTILYAKRLTASVQAIPLIKKQIEINELSIQEAFVNSTDLIEGMTLKGELGKLLIASHGISLNKETATIDKLELNNTHLSLCLNDTSTTDTTSSSPLPWKIDLCKADLNDISFAMQMPLDTLNLTASLRNASIKNGIIDLSQPNYRIEAISLTDGTFQLDKNNSPVLTTGLDPSHLYITNLNLHADSILYSERAIQANLSKLNLKERSGIEITSVKGIIKTTGNNIIIPTFELNTTDSYMNIYASSGFNILNNPKENMSFRLSAEIGKNDLFKFIPGITSDITKNYPSSPLQVKAGIDGNLNQIDLTSLSIQIPQIIRTEAKGYINSPLDDAQRNGNFMLSLETYNMRSFEKMMENVSLPAGIQLVGNAKINGYQLSTDVLLNIKNRKNAFLTAEYNQQTERYMADLQIDSLNIHHFLPNDSLYEVNASAHVEGKSFDFFSPQTSIVFTGNISQLMYGNHAFSNITIDADMHQSKAKALLNIQDQDIDLSSIFTASLHRQDVKANLSAKLNNFNFQTFSLTDESLKSALQLNATMSTDLKNNHKMNASLTNIQLITPKKTFKTKDLHAGGEITFDSVRCYVNAGDLTLLFKSTNNLENLTRQSNILLSEFSRQWKRKRLNQKLLKNLLPEAQLHVFSGADNPIANFIATKQLHYDLFHLSLKTSQDIGLNGEFNLYGLHTDSLRLDTITIKAQQDTACFQIHNSIKALTNKYQEGFNILLDGQIESTSGKAAIQYLNSNEEKGVDIGLQAFLRPKGISVHLSPITPTLLYRTFYANKNNFIFIGDKGSIQADLELYDENRSGLSFHSTPDSVKQQNLNLTLSKINISELRRIIPYMPDIAGHINAKINYLQENADTQVSANVSIDQFAYNKQILGNWSAEAVYLPKSENEHDIIGFLSLDQKKILTLNGSYFTKDSSLTTDSIQANVELSQIPLNIANAFIPDKMAILDGKLNGDISILGESSQPIMNGYLNLDSSSINIPKTSLHLQFDNRPIKIVNNHLWFDQFNLYTQGKSPFTINGEIDMRQLNSAYLNLSMNTHNFELINAKRSKASMIHGKLYVDLNSTIKGTPDNLTMRGNMNILGSSNFTYILQDSPLTVEDRLGETVTFVDFKDTTTVVKKDIPTLSLGGMDILMTLHIDEAVQARVDLNENGSNYMSLEGGGDLSFQYQPDGNMFLNGRYSLISGELKYELPIIPLKTFHIQNGSYIEWTGNIMNPNMNIKASERMRASVSTDGNSSRMVNFDVGINLTNRLENLGFAFTLEAPDDGNMQNELASKSVEEKNKLAITMLVTGMYLTEDNTNTKGLDTNSMLNSFLQGEINKIAGSALKTIDINFGMETTDEDATGTSRTDYNFQFAKRFWNNRFQVVIGGKISTGNEATQQQNEAFIDNISLEYRLDNSGTRYIKLFHNKNYESILDGEVIETGVGIVLRKKISKLGELFIFKRRKDADKLNQSK